jgi:hypothetical protein
MRSGGNAPGLIGGFYYRCGFMSTEKHFIPIWFFIGITLLAYGILIAGTGIYGLFSPPAHPVTLAELHAGIWWGALLLVVGTFYCYRFRP